MELPNFQNDYQLRADVPDLADYFGVWAIHSDYMLGRVNGLQGYNLTAHVAARQAEPSAALSFDFPVTHHGVGIISISGPMMKRASSLSGGTSTLQVRRQIREAESNDEITAVALRIDSPGGTVSGTGDLAADVAKLAQKKPVHAFIEDLGTSAAYWVASQATKVFANPTALVGSIGTYAVLDDLSGAAEQIGLKVHVVKAGEFKGTGVEGTVITEEQLADAQRVVNALNEHFLQGVAAGRNINLSTVRQLADGRMHPAESAADLNLIDGVQSFDQTIQQLSNSRSRNVSEQAETKTTEPKATTIAELKAACVGADPEFLVEQLEAGATLESARADFMALQSLRIEQLEKEKSEAKKKTTTANNTAPTGVDPLVEGEGKSSDVSGNAYDDFWNAVTEREGKGMARSKAVSAVVRAEPELHKAMLTEANAGRRQNA